MMPTDTTRLRALAEAARDAAAALTPGRPSPLDVAQRFMAARDAFADAAKPATMLALLDMVPAWQPIESAPKDGTMVLVWAAPRDGLSGFATSCAYHPDAGWCVCELRHATHWMPLPTPPQQETPDGE